MNWTVAKLVEATQGELLQGNAESVIRGVSTDTRALKPGDCFVPLTGETNDGHDFIPHALAKNVGAVLASRRDIESMIPRDVALIRVVDTLYGLGELARYQRGKHSIPVIGITGSNGKTSTKEMIAAILGVKHNVHKNAGNFNNLIGVPLTLLSLEPHHQAAVIEMGINVFGEMQRLVEIVKPTTGLVTNIHPAHLQGLESQEHILEEKGRLLTSLSSDDVAIINLDDDRLRSFSKRLKARTVTYSLADENAQIRLAGRVEIERGVSTFPVALESKVVPVRLAVLGAHQVQNALAAAAVAYGMGESIENIVEGLSRHRPVHQRMEIHQLRDGTVLVDDTYNANPMSMTAAARAVVEASRGKPVIFVLGEMREMGAEGPRLHWEVGSKIGTMKVAKLFTLGALAAELNRGARESGMPEQACHHASDHEEIIQLLRDLKIRDSWILVKGSRGMTMELVVQGLMNAN